MAKGPKTEGEAPADHEPLQAIVGARVREARRRAKLKQSELGAVIGSGQSHVFQIEAGEVNITLKTLVRLAEALGVEPRDLLLDKGAKPTLDHVAADQLTELLRVAAQEVTVVSDRLQRAQALLAGEADEPEPSTLPKG